MQITPTLIEGVVTVDTTPFADHRGRFMRLFDQNLLEPVIGERVIRQINFSRTEAVGAVRGMHYQKAPHAEMKLVRCLKGRVLDVAVDLRQGSPTFLQYHAEELTPETGRMLVIPEGCAHGFQVLEAGSELLYLHTAFYEPSAEGGVLHDDPALGIRWPLAVTDLSARDTKHPLIDEQFKGLVI